MDVNNYMDLNIIILCQHKKQWITSIRFAHLEHNEDINESYDYLY